MAGNKENTNNNNISPLVRVILVLILIMVFGFLNLFMHVAVANRLGNNYSDTSSIKMIDVGRYLPFEDGSELAHVDAGFTLSGDLPVLDGAAALVPVYASVIDSIYPEGSVTYEGGSFSDDNYYGENFAPGSVMQYKNTVRGFEAVVDGDTDIFFSAMPSAEQMQYALEKGVELEIVPIGREAFIFFVNSNNPVDNLTTDQIRKIYAGEYQNWNEVGGVNRAINPVSRVENSGSRTMMDKFMGDVPYGKKSPFVVTGASIGYSFRFYFETMVGNENVKMISVNGIYPSIDNIQNGSYPIATDFYVVYRKNNENPNIKIILDWILSAEGQSLIKQTGYVPLG